MDCNIIKILTDEKLDQSIIKYTEKYERLTRCNNEDTARACKLLHDLITEKKNREKQSDLYHELVNHM
jgi:hypothetical protein